MNRTRRKIIKYIPEYTKQYKPKSVAKLVRTLKNKKIHKKYPGLASIKYHHAPSSSALTFTPTTAFLIAGHGIEDKKYFIVPKDVIIIAKMQPYRIMMYDMASKLQNTVLCNTTAYTDPLNNLDIVYKELGNVAIFREGDRCPDFKYELFSLNEEPRNTFGIRNSGLYDINSLGDIQCSTGLNYIYRNSNDALVTHEIKEGIVNSYKNSIQPTQEFVKNIVNTFIPTHNMSYIKSLIRKSEIFIVRQSELIYYDKVPRYNIMRKGVYYNFLCRTHPITTESVNTNTQKHLTINEGYSILSDNPEYIELNKKLELLKKKTDKSQEDIDNIKKIREIINNMILTVITRNTLNFTKQGIEYKTRNNAYNNFIKPGMNWKSNIIKNRISEAERIRKRSMRNYYNKFQRSYTLPNNNADK